jgi:multidrug efflux pump subunit AcrB
MKSFNTNKLVKAAIYNFHLVVVLCLFVIILGILALVQLPKDLLPAANLPAVQILSFYSGMPVKDVEENLSARFERYTGQAIGIERQESLSLVGVSIVRNYFTQESDLNTAITQTTSLVMSVLRKLPPGTQPPLILPFDPMAAIPLALVAVSGDKPIENIYDTARYEVRNTIQAVPGAMAPTVMGGMQREIVVYLDPNKLAYYNFSPLSVLDRFSQLNTFIPAGDIKIGDFDYQILSNGLADNVADMNDFPLRGEYGVPVYVKDVGNVKDSGQIQTNKVLIDGKEQVYVPVYRQPGGNSIRVVDQVKDVIKKLETRLDGTKLTLVSDQSVFIRKAISSISEEALIGGALAAIMIFLFLGNPLSTFGVLLSLPLSLLFAFIGLRAFNQTINAMTLGGLALSIGVLVDNSIVVLENISRKLEAGSSAHDAALDGASEVAMPVLSATLATLTVLFPVIFLSGIVKILFSALAKSVMFVMIGSYLIAMTVIPLFASRVLDKRAQLTMPRFLLWIHNKIKQLTDAYGELLTKAIFSWKLILAGVATLFIIGLLLAPRIGTELFPRADSGGMVLTVRLASGTKIEKTTDFAKKLDTKLREWIEPKDLNTIIINAGVYYGFPAAFTPNVGTQDVFFNIELTKDRLHTSQFYAQKIREHITKEFPDIEMGVQLGGLLTSALNMGARAPIDVQIEGPDLKQSYQLAVVMAEKIKALTGAVDVTIQQRFDMPIVFLDIDRDKAIDLDVMPDEIVKNVVSAVSGSSSFDSSSIWVDPKTGIDYLMGVQFEGANISSIEQLGNIPIKGKARNRTLPLNSVANIKKSTGPSQATHVNFKPIVNIYLDAAGRDIGGLAGDVQTIINKTSMPKGASATIRGESAEMRDSIKSLGGGFLLAAVLVYLILVIQFRSFVLPLIIMTAVPLGLVGIVFMLLLTNTYFSIQAAIGAIFMIGIAVANGVLLIEFIGHHTANATSLTIGIVAGAKARLRPILMTSMASILGVMPMAIGFGHGSEANIPLGRAVIGGQLVSTLLTLIVVPILYFLLMQKTKAKRTHLL